MASEDIKLLKFREHVRKRPGMYIGSVDFPTGILREAIDNSIDELYATESADSIWIENTKGYCVVADNGRGIPIKESSKKGITMARLAVENSGSGSKFEKTTFKIGMNGVGVACTNALSSEFHICSKTSTQDMSAIPPKFGVIEASEDKYYVASYKTGILQSEEFLTVEELETMLGSKIICLSNRPSTLTIFKPDPGIFHSVAIHLPNSLVYVSYILDSMNKNAKIFINGNVYTKVAKSLGFDTTAVVHADDSRDPNPSVKFLISVGFQDKGFTTPNIQGSVNGLICNTGFHVKMFKKAYKDAYQSVFGEASGYEAYGMEFMVIVLANEPSFSSQTKEKLEELPGISMRQARQLNELSEKLRHLIKEHVAEYKVQNRKLIMFLKSQDKLGTIQKIKESVIIASEHSRSDSLMPIKLIDCSTTNRKEAELYIVEGKSAAGGLKQARDPKIHAILPLRGKPRNTSSLDIELVLENQEMRDLISSIGTGVNLHHDVSEIRYGKVILCSDADRLVA